MARGFLASGTDYLTGGSPVGTYPLSLSALVKFNAININQTIVALGKTGAADRVTLYVTSANRVALRSGGSTSGEAITANTAGGKVTTGQWYYIHGTVSSASFRSISVNGATFGSDFYAFNTTSGSAISALDRLYVGAAYNNGLVSGFYASSDIAEVAVWSDAAYTQDHIDALASRYSPQLIYAEKLAGYWPLFGRGGASDGEEDWLGANALTQNGSPTVADHPRIIYPSRRSAIFVPASVGGPPTLTGISASGITSGGATLTITAS